MFKICNPRQLIITSNRSLLFYFIKKCEISVYFLCFCRHNNLCSPKFDVRVGLRLFHYLDLMYVLSLEEELAGSVYVYLVQMARSLEEE